MPTCEKACFYLSTLEGEASPSTMPRAIVAEIFGAYAEGFDQHLSHLGYRTPAAMRAFFDELADLRDRHPAGLDALDIGCGTGLTGVEFRPLLRQLTGVDLSAAMLQKAQSRDIYDRLLVTDGVSALAELPDGYDLVLAGEVFNLAIWGLRSWPADRHCAPAAGFCSRPRPMTNCPTACTLPIDTRTPGRTSAAGRAAWLCQNRSPGNRPPFREAAAGGGRPVLVAQERVTAS